MKGRRCLPIILSAVMMAAPVASCTVFAEKAHTSSVAVHEGKAEDDSNIFEELPGSNELFEQYVEQQFFGNDSISVYGNYADEKLQGVDLAAYKILKEEIQKIAAGERSNSQIGISMESLGIETTWTASELGVDTLIEGGELSEKVIKAIEEKYPDYQALLDYLLIDCPYDLYWFDKSVSGAFRVQSPGMSYSSSQLTLKGELVYSFKTAGEYRNSGEYEVAVEKTGAAKTAADNAKEIVNKYSSYGDYEKLVHYKNEICNLVSYNQEAAGGNMNYGNPWQLVWVFDRDPATNVVCEGYAKAFQYLCDLTDFNSSNIKCYTVNGIMGGGTGAGRHMWNIVTMQDKKNYIVDVTNCDEGSIGADDKLFLASAEGNAVSGYTVAIQGQSNITYTYDEDLSGMYGGILEISSSEYDPSSPEEPVETPTETPAITDEPSNTPTETPVITEGPSNTPTETPVITEGPSSTPGITPSVTPEVTDEPSSTPTKTPTDTPGVTGVPSGAPTVIPTDTPAVTGVPSSTPTKAPTDTPGAEETPSGMPTEAPTETPAVTDIPAGTPTEVPVETPAEQPDTTVVENSDGSKVETTVSTQTSSDGSVIQKTEVVHKDPDGKTTKSFIKSEISPGADDSGVSIVVNVSKNADETITSATAKVSGGSSSATKKVLISGSIVKQIIQAANTRDVEISIVNKNGSGTHKVIANAADLTAGKKLSIVIKKSNGAYVLVNAKTYRVTKDGDVPAVVKGNKTYELMNSSRMNKLSSKILKAVKVKKTSKTVRKSKTVNMRLKNSLNLENVKSIKYTVSGKSIVTVTKKGVIKGKKAGTAVVRAKVTLKNGKAKTVKMKITVKK